METRGEESIKENIQEKNFLKKEIPSIADNLSQNPSKSDEDVFKQRKEKLIKLVKEKNLWVFGILIIAVIFGIYIRALPMTDHGGNPGLWDITTNTWTLGPDLDPWLFLRNAKTISEQGKLPKIDMMRNVPVGFNTFKETMILPYMMVWTHSLINLFHPSEIIFAAALFPVIMFGLTIISFFLFVKEAFNRKSKKSKTKANIIAFISTFFMIVIPIFVSRTIAGIPEKESAAFFFLFLSFYFFLKSWKSAKIKNAIIFGILSGISTGIMGLIWGGVIYSIIPITGANMIAFILGKINKKESFSFFSWTISSLFILIVFSPRYSLIESLTSISTGLASLLFVILIFDYIIWKTPISKKLKKVNLPKPLVSLILALIILTLLSFVFFGPDFLIEKIKVVHKVLFKPVIGRWNITVAENRQPNFKEWGSNFGPFVKGIPLMFWMFFIGSVVLFKKMLFKLKNKDAWILTFFYILFLLGIIFSRYSGDSIFNGENFISKAFYYLSAILLFGFLIYYYIQYHKEDNKSFQTIRFDTLLLFAIFVFTLLTARGAVRLIMVLGPIAPIFVSFLIVETTDRFLKTKDETWKIILGTLMIILLIAGIYTFYNYYGIVKVQAYNFVPNAYNQQWQKAMHWVREETPKDTVFAHWWDYGYWVQSIGNRATVTDGGNAIIYWNYLMGRHVLTGENQSKALEFLYNHNATHLLIDSTDIGKYTAFSSIGSDENYDRYSWVGTFLMDESQTQETKNETLYIYPGGTALDEDLIIEENGKEILLPGQKAGVGAIILPTTQGEEKGFKQPYAIIVYQGVQHKVHLRYLNINGKIFDFESGIEACAFIFPSLKQEGQKIRQNPIGASMFISPRLFRGMLSHIYIMDDPLERYPNFNLTHTESSRIIESLRNQGMQLPEFAYYNGIQGPIKIWTVEYTGDEEIKQEYLDRDYTKYIDWRL